MFSFARSILFLNPTEYLKLALKIHNDEIDNILRTGPMEYWIILLIYMVAMFLLISGWQYYGTRLHNEISPNTCTNLPTNIPKIVSATPVRSVLASAPDLCAKLDNIQKV